MLTNLKSHFFENHILVSRGLCAPKFGYRQTVNGVIKYNYSALNKKNCVNFSPLTSEITRLMFTHQNQIFGRPYFDPKEVLR